MKVIVVGCGRTGCAIASEMAREGHQVTVVDLNPLAFDRLPGDFAGDYISGPGIDLEVLRKAGIETADALVAVTKGDNTNIMIGQIAKFIFNIDDVVLRVVDPKVKVFYRDVVGLSCFCPTETVPQFYLELLKGE